MKIKDIAVCVLIVLLIIILVAAYVDGKNTAKQEEINSNFKMETIAKSSDFILFHNTVTDVLYLWKSQLKQAGLTEMSDPETGLPLTYERYLQLQEKSEKQ